MSVGNTEDRIKSKLERKMTQVAERLSQLQDDSELVAAQEEVAEELAALESEIAGLASSGEKVHPGVRERLDARRERLLARQEHLELKLDLLHERRDRLQESLEEMRLRIQEEAATVSVRVGNFSARSHVRRPSHSQSSARKMQDERRKILEMVQQGTISADEAARLLDALRTQDEPASRAQRRPRWVRIRVTDTHNDKVRVNLTLPVGLVRAGLRAGGSIAGVQGLDTAGLEEMLDRGEVGHLLDARDAADGERIEIYVE